MEEKSVGQYRLIERLGSGGMGEVYRAQDQRLQRIVAVKLLSSGDESRRRRFWQEAQAASALNHPNIVTVHDMVTEHDAEYLVMEYVPGKTLAELIRPGGMPLKELLPIATQMAGALAAAHAAGIVHRDVKPANVMVAPSGLVKVLDFGLAKLALPDNTSANSANATLTMAAAPLTVAGTILGTISYMSPEQAEGQPVDARSDVFSFGAVLYEMATGKLAFSGQSMVSTLTAILRDEPQPIPELKPGVPASLIEVVHRSLRKQPADRWQTMAEVHAELKRLNLLYDSQQLTDAPAVEMPTTAAPTAAPPAPAASTPKSGLPRWIPAAVFALFALVGGWWWWRQREPIPPPPPVLKEVAEAKPAEDHSLTNASIIEMVSAKVPPNVIISHVRTAPATRFDASTQGLIDLAKAGVPEPVIREMSSRWKQAPAPPVAPTTGSIAPPGAVPAIVAPKPATPGAASVELTDGRPLEIQLAADVPADPPPGTALKFTVKTPLVVAGMTVVPAGAPVTGEITEAARRRFRGEKAMFALREVTVGNLKLKVRAGSSAKDPRRLLENGSEGKSKTLAAAAGTAYLAYVDGNQSLPGR